MILESTQILCTILHEYGNAAPYRPTHKKHPCVVWAGILLDNWIWLRNLTIELNKKYQYRFSRQKAHQSFLVSKSLPLPSLPSTAITERPLIMPDKYKLSGDPITSYRYFYAYEKRHLLKYTKRGQHLIG
jgi:hypothetical protein